ncbi:MAG: hypothetical protein KA116_02015 [Proteobacteria bacterium]|nr:hypothetical protein [Pseudomonadota bacterium]
MGKIRVQSMLSYLLLALSLGGCTFLDQLKSSSNSSGQKSFFGKNGIFGGGHSGNKIDEALAVGRDIKRSKTPFGGAAPNSALVVLPSDRCHSGYITFGPLNGEYLKCEALGRGITRWSENNPATYRNGETDPVSGKSLRVVGYGNFSRVTQEGDWKSGTTSKGRRCWVFDSKFTAGKTPVGTYNINAVTSSKSSWGGMNGVYITPKNFRTHRGELFVHSSDQFSNPNSVIDEPEFSTVGCVRIRPDCQRLFNAWSKQNLGRTLEVRE